MSTKMLDATCDATGKVTAEGSLVEEATVISQGKQASSGVLLIEREKPRYLTSNATDIVTTIEKTVTVIDAISESLNQIIIIFNEIATNMTGASTAPPPTLASDLAQITTRISTLSATKTSLNSLKGALK